MIPRISIQLSQCNLNKMTSIRHSNQLIVIIRTFTAPNFASQLFECGIDCVIDHSYRDSFL